MLALTRCFDDIREADSELLSLVREIGPSTLKDHRVTLIVTRSDDCYNQWYVAVTNNDVTDVEAFRFAYDLHRRYFP